MNILSEFESSLDDLNKLAIKLSNVAEAGDIFLLEGALGVGKTSLARFLINSLFDKHKLNRPESIRSPSFPILINYPLLNFEICHFDLYRLSHKDELIEISLFEEIQKNISIIEWPNIVLNNFKLTNYYFIQFKFINNFKRLITIKHSDKLLF